MHTTIRTIAQVTALLAVTLFATAAFAAGGGGGDHHGIPWKHFIGSVVNFAIFLGILYKFAWPKVQEFFKNRREELLADRAEATRLREEAQAKLDEYNDKLAALEDERQELLDEYHKQGQREKERVVEEAKRQVEKMRADAEVVIAQEVKRAIASIEAKAVEQAVSMAQKMAAERLTARTSQDALVDDYLSDLGSIETLN